MENTRNTRRKPGRPVKGDRERLKSYGIRLSDPDRETLDRYCKRNKTTRGAAIRRFIHLMGG
ncbi:hypothetical protein [uncultured Dialister sp.]|uniref:hypothetical protein n=1 Tax=uncultured Dialister sp. TaxID=278064 RepID=UPI0025F3FDA9|nr:hypothetical protein [uncultured Dialister sp.]